MFNYLMTHLQVMPFFVESVLPFGRRDFQQDFPYSGFRNASRLRKDDTGVPIPELKLSGRHIEISYNLMSVEPYCDPEKPDERLWSIRMCSIYHAFDIETGKTSWITVKGNNRIRKLIEEHLTDTQAHGPEAAINLHTRFQRTLKIHLLLAQWAAEYWQSYISTIQEILQEKTRHANSISVVSSKSSNTLKERTRTLSRWYSEHMEKQRPQLVAPVKRFLKKLGSVKPKDVGVTETGIEMFEEPEQMENDAEHFSFDDLQDVQALGDKATEALVALRSNRNVLTQLAQAYQSMSSILEEPQWVADIDAFAYRVQDVVSHLDMQKANTDTLLTFVNERKNLVSVSIPTGLNVALTVSQLLGILQYENMEASRDLAQRAHIATCHMSLMTLDMQVVTRKMKTETISMRIITLVTLFFLPGTFISVSLNFESLPDTILTDDQTLMSTPIVTFEADNKSFSSNNIGQGALQFYVAVSLPLMCLTFFAWYIVHWWESRRAKQHAKAMEDAKVGDELL